MECQMEKLEHFDKFFSLRSIEGESRGGGQKHLRRVWGTMPSERTWQEKGFLVLRKIVLTLVQEDLLGLMEIV